MSRYAFFSSTRYLPLLAVFALTAVQAQEEFVLTCGGENGPLSGRFGGESRCVDATLTNSSATLRAGLITTGGRDPNDSRTHWELAEGVNIVLDGTELTADSTRAEAESGEIVFLELTGSPARITGIADDGAQLSGEAELIRFDRVAQTLELKGVVRFAQGPDALTTCGMTYNMRDSSFSTERGCETVATVRDPDASTRTDTDQRDP